MIHQTDVGNDQDFEEFYRRSTCEEANSLIKTIVNQSGEIIAKTTDDGALIGGHHRLSLAASIGQPLFWKDTGEQVTLDAVFFRQMGGAHRLNA
jgi:hypothetical protein